MNIRFNIKQLGKRKAILTERNIEIESNTSSISLRDLIAAIVVEQVKIFNHKSIASDEEDTTSTPLQNYIDLLTETGKAGFNLIYNDKKADSDKAVENALICFEDGIIAVFQGEEQLTTLNQDVDLTLDAPFTFLRLTFLAGSYW